MRVETTEGLKKLPDGTEFVSEPDCVWGLRYAGVRWQKVDDLTIRCLDPADGFGLPRHTSVCYLPSFKDPLPVRVTDKEKEKHDRNN